MNNFIGITEDRLHHIYSVARECYALAKERSYTEDFCRRMFMIGWNHDVGYQFAENQFEHAMLSEELLKLIIDNRGKSASKVLHAVRKYGCNTNTKSIEWLLLNIAGMTIDSKGNNATVEQRLADIKSRYGACSNQYIAACDLTLQLGLLKE